MMSYFYVYKASQWKKWMVIIVFSFFTAFFLWSSQTSPFVGTNSDQETVLAKGNKDEPYIALTFNISWGEEKVYDILKQLDDHNAQATFFVSGEWAERHPDILEEIIDGKHELGMLGYRYKSYVEQDIDQVRKDLNEAQEIFTKLGYDDVNLLRAPNGHLNKEVVELAEDQGFQVVQWNVNPNDWKNPGTGVIIDHIMKETSNGDIILLHASDAAKQTADSLKTILPGLKNKGQEFVSISELMSQAHTESKIVE